MLASSFRIFAVIVAVATLGTLTAYAFLHTRSGTQIPVAKAYEATDSNGSRTSAKLVDEEGAIRAISKRYIDALSKADYQALVGTWCQDAEYVAADGETTQGREAIAKLLEHSVAGIKGYQIRGEVQSLTCLTPEVAVEDGSVEYRSPDGDVTLNRYSAVWVKCEGQWQIRSVRDRPAEILETSSPARKLEPLAWLIGDWEERASDGELRLSCRWAPNHNFLLMDYTVNREGIEPLQVTQRIGWDAANGTVRSWMFDSVGGFGEGVWEREGDRWLVRLSGHLPNGGSATSSNTCQYVDANTYVWGGKDRVVEGYRLADTNITFTRIPALKIDPKGDR